MSNDISQNNKRIAKNTMLLYFRTFITMIVGLYTSRVMLQALGIENYGINAAIGGIVGMSSILTVAMSVAISRYITFALGKGDESQLKQMFSTSINAQILLSVVIALILEIIGVWFLNSEANIPVERLYAANWVLQCSIVSLAISLISSPFNATIVAHERMSAFAYVSIAEAILRLAVCFIIQIYNGDRLILFAILQIFVAIVIQSFYAIYCKRNFSEATYHLRTFDKGLLKELTVFSSWTILNSGAWTFSTQGVNMLINVFFGVTYNASRNIATAVNGAVQSFVGNFTTAFSPQITKSYAIGNVEYAVLLVNRATKFTLLLMYIFVVPVCMESEMILHLWLGDNVPALAPLFLRLAMFESLTVTSGSNLLKLVQANGNIKRYSIDTALYAGMVFPICWGAFRMGAPVWASYVIFIIIFFTQNFIRYANVKRLMHFSVKQHFKDCLWPFMKVAIMSFTLPICISYLLEGGIIRFLIISGISISWTILCCYILGLSKNEKQFLLSKIKSLTNRLG